MKGTVTGLSATQTESNPVASVWTSVVLPKGSIKVYTAAETWTRGTTRIIQWYATHVQRVNIFLESSDGKTCQIGQNVSAGAASGWNYTVPLSGAACLNGVSLQDGTYNLIIQSAEDATVKDLSDEPIRITAPVPITSTSTVAGCINPILRNPLQTTEFEDLKLNTATHPEILSYRIQWFSGSWSPWYVPGVDDVDWKTNADGSSRRIWSYFADHVHQVCLSPSGSVSKSEFSASFIQQVQEQLATMAKQLGNMLDTIR